jgi:predicted metal-dependent hydrolase
MDYTVIKSKRKTLALQIKGEALIVRAPLKMSEREIERFITEHSEWIEKHLKKSRERIEKAKKVRRLTDAEIEVLTERAKMVFAERVAHYAPLIGVDYAKITVRRQKMRWGSCSSKGNLNFNYRLMLAVPEVIDYVVVHEMCHLLHMNHSKEFWYSVEQILPDYKSRKQWLKEWKCPI